jgi:hypothetical protein
MDDSKIFSNTHEAYQESFQILQDFGIFGVDNPTKKTKLWLAVVRIVVFWYPIIAFILRYKSIDNFGETIEHTALFVSYIAVVVQLINIRIWKQKICEIATSFQELKKFDENGNVGNNH